MVYWITGRKNSGKTTLAYRLKTQIPNSIVLDGDEFRKQFPIGYTYEERKENITHLANIAVILEKQNHVVIIACVSPYRNLRKKLQNLFDECIEICLPFGELWENTTFEESEN